MKHKMSLSNRHRCESQQKETLIINLKTKIMTRFKKCIDCGNKIDNNFPRCSRCLDIKLFGSVEKAREAARANFKLLGL